ncbi:E3 ubiquitin protein ligase PRT6 isoform X1, partial [Tanacetum coccineum]
VKGSPERNLQTLILQSRYEAVLVQQMLNLIKNSQTTTILWIKYSSMSAARVLTSIWIKTGNFLQKFDELDSVCLTKLQTLAPDISHFQPSNDASKSSSMSDSNKRKAKAHERQAAIVAKMTAHQYTRRIDFEGGHIVDPVQGEFLCPVFQRLANSVLPDLPKEK